MFVMILLIDYNSYGIEAQSQKLIEHLDSKLPLIKKSWNKNFESNNTIKLINAILNKAK